MSNQGHIKDTSWLRASFLSLGNVPRDVSRYQRSRGWLKFMDTTLGGNTAINAPYQYTRFADIPERRLFPDVGCGMGRWYSENIDDWGHNVHFRVGIPTYVGLLPFALRAINGPAARYVATGRSPGMLSTIGKFVGYVVSAAFWEMTLLNMFINNMLDLTSSRYYYLKPTMHQYWLTVQTILDSLSGNLGLYLNSDESGNMGASIQGGDTSGPKSAHILNQMPGTFRSPTVGKHSSMSVDIHAVASRAQGLEIKQKEEMIKALGRLGGGTSPEKVAATLEQAMNNSPLKGGHIGQLKPTVKNATIESYFAAMQGNPAFLDPTEKEGVGKGWNETFNDFISGGDNKDDTKNFISGWFEKTVDSFTSVFTENRGFKDSLLAELQDGAQWVSFRVADATSSVTESISNSAEQSDIANIFNQMSQTSRGVNFNLAGGKTGIGIVDNVMDTVLHGVGDLLVDAAATSMNFLNPIIGLMYGAKIEMPKRWSDSQTSLSSTSFKIQLRAGYGNLMSYYQDILVPLAMLLAMALPRGTGKQSYGSPFYVQYYNKGRSQVSIGLISSLTINRGVGNAAWHRNGYPMAVDVDISIEDMSNIMFAPVTSNLVVEGPDNFTFSSATDDSAFGDYLAVLSALGMAEQEYFGPKFKRKLYTLIHNFDSWLSPHRWASAARSTALGGIASAFVQGTTVRN